MMSMTCTKCEGTGFLNTHQIPEGTVLNTDTDYFTWINDNKDHDVQICDCCGDGVMWHDERGEHYNGEEEDGVYEYNNGLCECN